MIQATPTDVSPDIKNPLCTVWCTKDHAADEFARGDFLCLATVSYDGVTVGIGAGIFLDSDYSEGLVVTSESPHIWIEATTVDVDDLMPSTATSLAAALAVAAVKAKDSDRTVLR